MPAPRKTLTPRQREMLLSFDRDGEATDYAEFCNGSGALAWRNRERVIEALHRKGFLSNAGITEAGKTALGRDHARAA